MPTQRILVWNTLRHLRPIQWQYRLKNQLQAAYYRGFPDRVRASLNRRVPEQPRTRSQTAPVKWFRRTHDGRHGMFTIDDLLEKKFRFLNCEKAFKGPITWKNPEFTYLWDFNLHYFEYLPPLVEMLNSDVRRHAQTEAMVAELLDGWIEENQCPGQPAWHPYTTSLRIVNWIKAFSTQDKLTTPLRLSSLYAQALFLERNIEGHLMVNHIWENARALIFAGIFFEGTDAARWLEKGSRILKRELVEELLPHGGHFERSPMYHTLLTEGLLDAYAYLTANGLDTGWLTMPLRKMCEWMFSIRCPDGWFPLFNDAVFGISASADDVLSDAERIIGFRGLSNLVSARDCDGCHILDGGVFFCAVDGAPIGPDYNPGHAHADNLTFEAYYKGERLVVDSGIYHYDADDVRRWYRSSVSHNTVVINDVDQSEVWGGFRVGRRSHPLYSASWESGGLLIFHGIYKNCVAIAQNIVHERIIVVDPSEFVLVWDTITARQGVRAQSYCQFAPDWSVNEENSRLYLNLHHKNGSGLFCVRVGDGVAQDRLQGYYAPEFGLCRPVERVRFSARGNGRVEMGYMMTVVPPAELGDISAHRNGNVLTFFLKGSMHGVRLRELIS